MSPQPTKGAPATSRPALTSRRSTGAIYETSGKKQASILSFFSRQPDAPLSSSSAPAAGERKRLSSPPGRSNEDVHSNTDEAQPPQADKKAGSEPTGAKELTKPNGSLSGSSHFSGDTKPVSPKKNQPRLSVCKREDDLEEQRQRDGCTPPSKDRKKLTESSNRAEGDFFDAKRHRPSTPAKNTAAEKTSAAGEDPESEDVRKFKRIKKGTKVIEEEEEDEIVPTPKGAKKHEKKKKKEEEEEEEQEEEEASMSDSDSSYADESEEEEEEDDDESDEEEEEEEDEEVPVKAKKKQTKKPHAGKAENSRKLGGGEERSSHSGSTSSPSRKAKLASLLYSPSSSSTTSTVCQSSSETASSTPLSSPSSSSAPPSATPSASPSVKSELGSSSALPVSRAVSSCPSSSASVSSAPRPKTAPLGDDIEVVKRKLLASPAAQNCHYFRHFIEDYYAYHQQFCFPPWVDPAQMKDSKGRRAIDCDPSYDFGTLWVPSPDSAMGRAHARPHLTPGMAQYWEIKKKHFDKLILFKIGKFYEFVYGDACAAHRILDLRWMGRVDGETKAHCGFPEQVLHQQAKLLVNAGYKVVVVEQMETPKELEKRNSQAIAGTRDKAVKREVCEVMSAGTVRHADMLASGARYLLVLYFGEEEDDEEGEKEVVMQEQRRDIRDGVHHRETSDDAKQKETRNAQSTATTGGGGTGDGEGAFISEEEDFEAALNLAEQSEKGKERGENKDMKGPSGDAESNEKKSGVFRPGFAACLADVSTCRISLLRLPDDPSAAWPSLRLLLAQTLPVEVVYSPANMPPGVLKLLKLLPCAPQLSPLGSFPDLLNSAAEVERYVSSRLDALQKNKKEESRQEREEVKSEDDAGTGSSGSSSSTDPGFTALSLLSSLRLCLRLCDKWSSLQCALGGLCAYLRSSRLDQSVLSIAQFEPYKPYDPAYMLLDANALRQLEVLQTQEGNIKYSLFGYLDKTVTSFGHRLLRRWVVAPLRRKRELDERLDAVEFLLEHPCATEEIRKRLSGCPDIERLAAKICAQGLQAERKAVYFDHFHQKLLGEFLKLLDAFENIEGLTRHLSEVVLEARGNPQSREMGIGEEQGGGSHRSHRLEILCRGRQDGGIFPSLGGLISELRKKIATDKDGSKIPARGVLPAYDEVEKDMERKHEQLERCLSNLRSEWKMRSLIFVHSKFKYEVECPDGVSKQLLRDYDCDVTSSRKGFIRTTHAIVSLHVVLPCLHSLFSDEAFCNANVHTYRFRTPEICELVSDMEDLEQQRKDLFYPFFSILFNSFYANFASSFGRAIHITAELDCLQSLAYVVAQHPGGSGRMCRPKILEPRDDEPPVLSLKNCRHPVAETLMDHFVPNDVYLNTNHQNEKKRTLLLTGPNMGGKSTLLRQTCLCVIMAQIGCFVPADSCTVTPVDRVFTRLGAEDFILQGASTFLVELKDVSNLMNLGTRHSLAVIDELGRGTSTFDGTAIALASVEYITDVLQCRCLFATHYHLLCYELQRHPHILNVHMKAAIDEQHGSLAFLYKLADGICPKSHGIHVAKLAGIEPEILQCAEEKSLRLQQEIVTQQRHWRLFNVARKLIGANNDAEVGQYFRENREQVLKDLADEETEASQEKDDDVDMTE
ncbi:dna mismatch repair protein msh6 [Cystoisospora suis]|uniref:Dna mismatch repair protein msh6 n=1 Tax=Cystoisospora suis TaxID=483139 RepID=A0A2C6L9N1_9APIC|nr:dna mismatch repair protein msh6 [Cystoisospora suis]